MTKPIPILFLALLLLQGCVSFNDGAGKFLASVAATVDAQMQGWAKYTVIAKVSDADQAPVKAAYLKYQASMATAEVAYIALVKSNDQSPWLAAKEALLTSQNQLLALIQAFSTKGVK